MLHAHILLTAQQRLWFVFDNFNVVLETGKSTVRAAREDGFVDPRRVTDILEVTQEEVAPPPVQPSPPHSQPSMPRLPQVSSEFSKALRQDFTQTSGQKLGHTEFVKYSCYSFS